MDTEYMEVDFEKYCKTCKYKDNKEWEDPCNECLEYGMRSQTRVPKEWDGHTSDQAVKRLMKLAEDSE